MDSANRAGRSTMGAPVEDLAQWLGQQLDADERIARFVGVPHDWHQGPGDDPEWTDEALVCMWPPEFHTPYEEDKHWRGLTVAEGGELAAFIAAHDPARVLREVDAKREALAHYERIRQHTRQGGEAYVLAEGAVAKQIQIMAVAYTDRPGYRESRRP
jgi:hypothetical protein